MISPERTVTVAVVGAGPRGISVVERIAAPVSAGDPLLVGRVIVHLIDPHPVGGRVWDVAQPGTLLMNTVAGDATLYLDETVTAEGPVIVGPTLLDWAASLSRAGARPDLDPDLLTELAALTPTTALTRRSYGAYLGHVLADVADRLRGAGAELVVHVAVATTVTATAAGERVLLDDGTVLDVDAVVLALGHGENEPTAEERSIRAASESGGWTYLGPANPIDQDWDRLPAGGEVVVRGLGLNFFDAMALVTIGRGGVFERAATGELRYHPSGREPVLWAGSRRGIPFKAKARMRWPRRPVRRRYPSEVALAGFAEARAAGGAFDFDRDGWPWVRKEALFQYYAAQLGDDRTAEVAALFDAADGSSVPSPEELLSALPEARHDFDPDRTGDPFAGAVFDSQPEAEAAVVRWIERDLAEARLTSSAIKAGDAAIGASRSWLSPLSDFGGFTPRSHRRFEGWFGSYANSLAGGPPALRTEQLLALVAAGIVRFLPPGPVITADADGVTVTSAAVPGWSLTARALVEARIHPPSIRASTNPLIRSLVASGRARSFVVPGDPDHDPDGDPDHDTDGLEVTTAPYRLVGRDGRAAERLFALGIPLGVHIGTSFTAFARSDSPFLRQTDAVARAALDAATSASPQPL